MSLIELSWTANKVKTMSEQGMAVGNDSKWFLNKIIFEKILMALATPPRPPLMAKGQGGRIEDSFGISNVYCLIKHLLICMTLLPTEITPGSIQDALSK